MNQRKVTTQTPILDANANDDALVAAARASDPEAFPRLVERYFGTVWAIAYARLGRTESADDLAQEVFLMAFLHLRDLSDPGRFAGWLSQITHNRAANWLRGKQRSSRLVAMVELDDLADRAVQSAEPAMDQNEQHQAVRDAVLALPEQQRELVLLHFAEGLSHKQIADRLEVHPATVGRQLDKALATLRRSLGSWIEQSIKPLRAPRQQLARTMLAVGAVAAMSSAARTSLCAAAGRVLS